MQSLGLMAQACNLNSEEAETGGYRFDFEASLCSYDHCFKKKKKVGGGCLGAQW